MGPLAATGQRLLQLFSSHRRLWLPFLTAALLEVLLLGVLWLAPQSPFSTLLAPPLQFFFGRKILHYPWHLWFLYYAMKHTHVLASLLLGAYLSGVACEMVGQGYRGQPLSLREALVSRRVRYGTVTMLWVVSWAAVRAATEAFARFVPVWWGVALVAIGLQALLVYAIPVAVFERTPWWNALWRSVRETQRHPVSTVLVVAAPNVALLAFAMQFSPTGVWQWMRHTTPELVLWVVTAQLILWTVADALLTVAVAHLWWLRRAPAAAPGAVMAPTPQPPPGRRPTAAFIGVTALLGVGIGVFGCSADYQGERLLWKAQRMSSAILKDPASATTKAYDEAYEALERVKRAAPDTSSAARADLDLGRLHELQGDHDEARAAYNDLLVNYRRHAELCISAYLELAKTYQAERRWDDVVATFQALSDDFRWSKSGLQAPMWIGELYEALQDEARAAKAYDRAALLYTQWIPSAPSPELTNLIRNDLVSIYQRLGRWDRAAEVLEALSRQTAGVDRPAVLMTLGTIYQTKLHEPQKSLAAYETLVAEFPDHPSSQEAKARLMDAQRELSRPPQPARPPAPGTVR